MSDISPRGSVSAARMLADALLRNLTGTSAQLRVTNTNSPSSQSELGLITTDFSDITVSPVAMRRLHPQWQATSEPQWELLVSATSVEQQAGVLDLMSAEALFRLTLAVTIGEKRYLLDSFTSNEAFGRAYLYRLLLREVTGQGI